MAFAGSSGHTHSTRNIMQQYQTACRNCDWNTAISIRIMTSAAKDRRHPYWRGAPTIPPDLIQFARDQRGLQSCAARLMDTNANLSLSILICQCRAHLTLYRCKLAGPVNRTARHRTPTPTGLAWTNRPIWFGLIIRPTRASRPRQVHLPTPGHLNLPEPPHCHPPNRARSARH